MLFLKTFWICFINYCYQFKFLIGEFKFKFSYEEQDESKTKKQKVDVKENNKVEHIDQK